MDQEHPKTSKELLAYMMMMWEMDSGQVDRDSSQMVGILYEIFDTPPKNLSIGEKEILKTINDLEADTIRAMHKVLKLSSGFMVLATMATMTQIERDVFIGGSGEFAKKLMELTTEIHNHIVENHKSILELRSKIYEEDTIPKKTRKKHISGGREDIFEKMMFLWESKSKEATETYNKILDKFHETYKFPREGIPNNMKVKWEMFNRLEEAVGNYNHSVNLAILPHSIILHVFGLGYDNDETKEAADKFFPIIKEQFERKIEAQDSMSKLFNEVRAEIFLR